MPKITSLANQKGGVAKTTSAMNIAAAMARAGKKTLVIDLDPQGNASTGLGIKFSERVMNIYDVLIGKISIEDAIINSQSQNLFIIPSVMELAAAEFELQKLNNWQYILRNYLQKIFNKYDYILIDCPPSLGLLTINALVASNTVIIPLQCEFFALEGLSHLLETIQKIKKQLNQKLKIDGVLLTMYDKRNNLSRFIEKDVRENLGSIVYDNVIPRNVSLPEASSYGRDALTYNISSMGAKAYIALVEEILTKESAGNE